VLDVLQTTARLIDVRIPSEFAGQAARAKRKGHIPGAVNQPRTDLVQPDGTILPPAALRAKFEALGIDDSLIEVIVYCNGGVSASYGLMALDMYTARFMMAVGRIGAMTTANRLKCSSFIDGCNFACYVEVG
jgi:3-mercaptopyruvate sulfurtransferase SseA